MWWFRRRINRWRNFTPDGEYAGSQGGGSSGGSSSGDGTEALSATEFAVHAVRMKDTLDPT